MMKNRQLFFALCALSSLVLTTPVAADSVTTFKNFLRETRTLDAEFSQTITGARSKQPQVSRGQLSIQRPGKFRWQVREPFAQLLVGDGERVWLYDKDLEQVTVRRMGDALTGTPAALLAGDPAKSGGLDAEFDFSDEGEREGMDWAVAQPKAPDASFSKVRLGFKAGDLQAMELHDQFGQVTRIAFTGLRRNVVFQADKFRFTVPAGVDVIGE